MAEINRGDKLPFPKAIPGERVDILSFVVTKAGWESLKYRIGISQSNTVRILTRLIHKSASELIEQAGDNWKWHHLPSNHAKAILYHKQKLAILGSFNVTEPSFGKNIECSQRVDETGYRQLAREFEAYWKTTELDERAFGTPTTWQAVATLLNHSEEAETRTEAPSFLDETADGPRKPFAFQEPIIQQVMAWLDTPQDFELGRIVKLPTGAGKTLVAAEVIRRLLEERPQARILWVCHRVELLRQSVGSIRRQINGAIPEAQWFIPKHIQDEFTTREPKQFTLSKDCQMVFCTQQMLRYLLSHNRNTRFDLTVIDECHRFHPRSKWYKRLCMYCRDRSIPRLGLTATPLPSEKRGFGKYWVEAMYGEDISKDYLEREGFLSRFNRPLTKHWPTNYDFVLRRPLPTPESNESELTTRIGEFNNPIVNKEVERAWQEYRGQRQRVLCFAVTTDHADKLKDKYFPNDHCVQIIHSKLDPKVNRERLEWFKNSTASESRMIISVLMLTEGIDLPKTDCLFMVRPTFSDELYQQMIGRGLRGPNVGGTEDCAIVDFTSQYVDRNGRVLPSIMQITTNLQSDGIAERDEAASEEDEEPDDLTVSGRGVKTVKDLRRAVDDLRNTREMSIQDACQELAQDLDYAPSTLNNYYHTKPDDYLLEPEDEEVEGEEQSGESIAGAYHGSERSIPREQTHDDRAEGPTAPEGYVTSNKLLDLRAYDPQRFEEIASLTNVAPNTLRSYCSDQQNFKRWKTNNKDKMDQVRVVLAEFLKRDDDAA